MRRTRAGSGTLASSNRYLSRKRRIGSFTKAPSAVASSLTAGGAVTISVRDANGDPLEAVHVGDRTFVVGQAGQRYSIVLECLPNGLAIYDRTRLEQAFGQGPYLHITIAPVGDRGRYTVADRPKKSDITSMVLPPNCFGLPYGNNGLHPVMARYPGKHPSDNYQCAGYTAPPTCPPGPRARSHGRSAR